MLVGIDFGAKLAGTTAIAFIEKDNIGVLQTQKKQDADIFLLNWLQTHKPAIIGIDAPLSLPQIYVNSSVEADFFYRKADKLLGAMSPLFLGGLTARAMQLKYQVLQIYQPIFLEVYPAALAQKWTLYEKGYRKEISQIHIVAQIIQKEIPFLLPSLQNWHQIDAILAFCTTFRYQNGLAEGFGEAQEGIVWV
ncbi:MAG: DUF429 domain-containing protein [Raineya sp.]|nr:DUF429 domain-containing protein [Raineya sp.]